LFRISILGFRISRLSILSLKTPINQKRAIMQNEPNFQKSQMIITLLKTTNYNEKRALDTLSKQTQSNPISKGTLIICYFYSIYKQQLGTTVVNNKDFQKTVELINKSSNVLLTTHARPDGDACGSVIAMYDTLTTLGKKVKMLMLSPVPEWYEFLFAEKAPVLGEDVDLGRLTKGRFGEFDLITIIDTNCSSQLPKLGEYLKQADTPVLVIDHHVTTDGLGNVELIDTTAAATGLIVLDLLRYAGWQVTEKIAQALFVAAATDTGWFQFSNTDSRVHRSCAELIDAGVNPTQVYHDMYQNFSHQRFKLMTAMLNTLELHFDGRLAMQHLLRADFERTGAAFKDTENLIDECRRISTVEAAALFVELPDGQIKVSLRSSGAINVRRIAEKFGGGGHTTAAGVHFPGPIEKAKELILAEMTKQFKRLESE